MPTLAELAAELGIPAETLAAKQDVVNKWNGYFTAAESQAADAQKKLEDAQALQRVIDENIAKFGMTETNVAQLEANNAALKAALEAVKAKGFSGIEIPELPKTGAQPSTDPMADFKNMLTQGFSQVGQTINISNRYQRIFGKPMPDDPSALADEAARRRMPLDAYAEQKYGFTAAEQKQQAEAQAKREEQIAAEAVRKYQEAHPSTAGHPELNPGMPSQFSAMPKPREAKDIRSFAAMPARDKIANAMQRANEAAKSSAA